MHSLIKAEPEVTNISPINHGNAWAIYFQDPEGNRIEVFTDTLGTSHSRSPTRSISTGLPTTSAGRPRRSAGICRASGVRSPGGRS